MNIKTLPQTVKHGRRQTFADIRPILVALIICPPLVLLLVGHWKKAIVSFIAIVGSLMLAYVYHTLNSWPYTWWSFPFHFIAYAASIYAAYKILDRKTLTANPWNVLRTIILVTGLFATIYVTATQLVISRYAIASVSMNPALTHGDYVITSKVAQQDAGWFQGLVQSQSLAHGDVVIFKHPQEEEMGVKRIVALAGDTISFQNNELSINGTSVKRDLIPAANGASSFRWLKSKLYYEYNHQSRYKISVAGESPYLKGNLTIPDGHVFVLGDNRNQSIDSRFWGVLPVSSIVEKPIFIWWSVKPGIKPSIRWDRVGKKVG